MTKQWEVRKEQIRVLYHDEGRKLTDVMRLMKGRHGFSLIFISITRKRSYHTQLKRWGYLKYKTKDFPKPTRNRCRRLQPAPPAPEEPTPTPAPQETTPSIPGQSSTSQAASDSVVETPIQTPVQFNLETNGRHLLPEPAGPSCDIFQQAAPFDLRAWDIQGKTYLHRAVIDRDVVQVKALLRAGIAVDIPDRSGNHPLHYAVIADALIIVELLLDFGASINKKGMTGRSPLHLAVSSLAIVRTLLKERADPSLQDDNGDTPLHLALRTIPDTATQPSDTVPFAVIDAMLEARPDLNKANKAGDTPFSRLLDRPYSTEVHSCVRSFLSQGASTTQSLPYGRTTFQIFLSRALSRPYEELLSHAQTNGTLKCFLENGASVVTLTPSGEPLALHCLKGLSQMPPRKRDDTLLEKICELVPPGQAPGSAISLLQELLNPSYQIDNGITRALTETLVKNDDDLNRQDEHGRTVLLLVVNSTLFAFTGTLEVIRTLLRHGAAPRQQDLSGACALFEAAKQFPDSGIDLLRPMLEADLRLHEASPKPPGSFGKRDDEAQEREFCDQWDQAIESTEWSEAKQHILRLYNSSTWTIGKTLRENAFAVLAEKHVRLAKDKFRGDSDETEKRRQYVAKVLQDCRTREISVDRKCFDDLLDLCL
ncbi:hypothetical protein QQX98_003967 [Neonectria punicea]|uniref:Clr5 domain-containing protein n=1 Tax=Neonectria punicea TaxID=979145 RepID=A0ABR1HC97_9HYPO